MSKVKSSLKSVLKTGIVGCATTLFLCSTVSCNRPPLDFTWSGNVGDFLQSYTKYDGYEISFNETLNTYLSNENSKTMLEQDLAYCICNSDIEAFNITFTLDMQKIDPDSQRLSFYWIVKENSINNEETKIYEMQVSNLKYIPIVDTKAGEDNALWFVPDNVSVYNRTIIVDPKFWTDDSLFEILVNDYTVDTSYVFSYRQQDLTEQQIFEYNFVNYFVFSPFFYGDTQIIISQ